MLPKKKEERNKSAQSNSPYHKKLKEGTLTGMNSDGKHARIGIWPEWSEIDINNEKWDIPLKTKEKDKARSPLMTQNLFEDPEGLLKLPSSLKVFKWKRTYEYFTKNPVIVDTEEGIHKFDIFSLNEHLFISETMRWIICQINNLWITSEKKCAIESSDTQIQDISISSNGTHHTWRFWEHIYSLNKVGKGFPQYNPAGKYIVKLFWMGDWRKILVDDTLPFDENDRLLLPVTTITNELWPLILSKALLKIASLSYNFSSNETEFGDFSVIHSLTGWIPQKKIVSKEYRNQIVNDLSKLLNHWTYSNENCNLTGDKNDISNVEDIQHIEVNLDKTDNKEILLKDKNKKDTKENKPKEKKEKDKTKSEKLFDGKNLNENPETLVIASYNSSFNKLQMLSTSKMASRYEALRKIGMPSIYSHPVILNYYRDSPLEKSISPELIPSWKLIRPFIKVDIPQLNDCTTHSAYFDSKNVSNQKDDQSKYIEIQTPFINYKLSKKNNSTKEMFDENLENLKIIPHCTSKSNNQIMDSENMGSLDSNFGNSNSKLQIPCEFSYENEVLNLRDEERYDFSKGLMKSWIDVDTFFECFEVLYIYHKTETYRYTESLSDFKLTSMITYVNANSRDQKRSVSSNVSSTAKKSKDILRDPILSKSPITLNVNDTLSYNVNNFKTTNIDQKEPFYLFTDNIDNSEIIICLSVFCKWFTHNDPYYLPDNANNRNSPSINIVRDKSNNLESNNDDNDPFATDQIQGVFFAENHYWKNFKIGKCLKRAKTNGTKAVSLKFPPGRHCLRIFIQALNGFHCKFISQNQFFFGTEDEIIPLAVECPKRIQSLGIDIISAFKNMISNFSNDEERKSNEIALNNLILDFSKNSHSRALTSEFTQVFSQGIIKTIKMCNRELLTSDMIFALRAIILDFQSYITLTISNKQNNNSSRNSAKIPPINSKIDNRKQSSTKSLTNIENKEEKRNEFFGDYSSRDMLYIIRLQKLIKGYYVRKVIMARSPRSNYHDRVVNELNKIKTLIEHNSSEIGNNLLNEIFEIYPQISKHYGLDNDQLNHIKFQEFKGNGILQPVNGFGMLFREIFHIDPLTKKTDDILIKLNCNVQKCTLSIINNDNGEKTTEIILKRLNFKAFVPNSNGNKIFNDIYQRVMLKQIVDNNYDDTIPHITNRQLLRCYTLIATTKDVENVVPWKLKIIGGANNLLPTFIKQELCNDFSIFKIRDYYVPEEDGLLFHQIAKIKLDHPISVFVKLSNPNVSLRLSIYNFDEELYFVEGIGEAYIESFLLLKDYFCEEQVDLVRSGSRNSTKLKKGQEKVERYSSKTSGTNSSCSNEEKKVYKYSIRASVNNSTWLLSQDNEEFVNKLKLLKRKNMNEQILNDNPSKLIQSSEFTKKENVQKILPKTKTKERGQEGIKILKGTEKPITKNNPVDNNTSRPNSTYFESDKQHWTALIISDTCLEDNIQIYKNNEKHDTLCSTKKIWLEMDTLRFEKGKQVQMKYNEENQVTDQSDRNSSEKYLDLSLFYPIDISKNDDTFYQSRYNFIDLFRQNHAEWDTWRKNEKVKRIKKINDTLDNYHNQQKIVNSNRLIYFKIREKIKHE